jgi:hypothetical protein
MTEHEDHSDTRPISVAELLAKNGNIGSPPVGGRRRRRRGNADSVTVAELTGEIPIVTDTGSIPVVEPEPEPEPEAAPATNGATAHVESPVAESHATDTLAGPSVDDLWGDTDAHEVHDVDAAAAPVAEDLEAPAEPEPTEAEADYEAHLEQRDSDESPLEFAAPPRRPHVTTPPGFSAPSGGAETMSPDPVGDDLTLDGPDVDLQALDFETDADDDDAGSASSAFGVPSYLRSNSDTLFGGQSMADDVARRGAAPGPEDIDLGEDHRLDDAEPEVEESRGSAVLRGAWVVVQCILAVAFGAGLFIAFDLLWKWNTIVALVLAVLVILGLVAGVRVVRKTEDIASTLIAVAVGALVAFGPLALLQSH